MKYQNVTIANLKDANQCMETIDAIELDRHNYNCTDREWFTGAQTNLKVAAKRKIEAITRKLYRFPDGDV